jgi:hypothetical protein
MGCASKVLVAAPLMLVLIEGESAVAEDMKIKG